MILQVKSGASAYDIVLERGALNRLDEYLPRAGKALIVTDDGVPAAYARAVAAACEESMIVTLPQGERTKNLDNHRYLLSRMLQAGFTRSDRVIAVGGGVMGDLAGFAASVYMRGIAFYNVPTTLLSQVDSSIGGKVAVDMDGVKNIVGAFYPPKKVVIDSNALATLSPRQVSAGLAESIKMAATCDAALFESIERLERVLAKYHLPTTADCSPDKLASLMAHDKKATDGGVNAVCVDEIGSFVFRKMSIPEIAERMKS